MNWGEDVVGTRSIAELSDNLLAMRIGTPVSKQTIKDLLGFIQSEDTSSGITTGRDSAAAFQRASRTNRARRPIGSSYKTKVFIDESMIEAESYRNDHNKHLKEKDYATKSIGKGKAVFSGRFFNYDGCLLSIII